MALEILDACGTWLFLKEFAGTCSRSGRLVFKEPYVVLGVLPCSIEPHIRFALILEALLFKHLNRRFIRMQDFFLQELFFSSAQ